MTAKVNIYEVSMRDGLQNEAVRVPTEQKLAYLNALIQAGCRDIEVTSFVRPRMIPQLSDASALVRSLPKVEGVRFWALVPNIIGLDRARESGIKNVATFMSVSETHNRKNLNRTVKESLSGLKKVIRIAKSDKIRVRSYLSTVFGCPYEGPISPLKTVNLVEELLAYGADTIVLGDTIGSGTPVYVDDVLSLLEQKNIPKKRISLHFHDTMGMAVVNAYTAYRRGYREFDGAVAGIGGCPYAPGATGNAATGDLVHLFQALGHETGIDLEKLGVAGHQMERLLGRKLPGRIFQYLVSAAESSAVESA